MNRGNPLRTRTGAQVAAVRAQNVERYRLAQATKKRNRIGVHPEPFGRAPSNSLTGGEIKTVQSDLRAMIDAAWAKKQEGAGA